MSTETERPLINPDESLDEAFARRRAARTALAAADDSIAAVLTNVGMTADELVTSPFGGNSSSTEYWTVSAVKLAELLDKLGADMRPACGHRGPEQYLCDFPHGHRGAHAARELPRRQIVSAWDDEA